MISLLIRLSLALLVLNALLVPVDAWGDYGIRERSYGTYGINSKDPNTAQTFDRTSFGLPSQNATRKGLGISAWGIVIIVVALILAGAGLYYFSICYNVCQTNKSKYDKMGIPTVA